MLRVKCRLLNVQEGDTILRWQVTASDKEIATSICVFSVVLLYMSTFKPNNQTYSIYSFYGNLRTYTTWRILRFKCHLKEFKLRVCGNGKRPSRFCWQINFFASSYLKRISKE
jgi:hypothetical protein